MKKITCFFSLLVFALIAPAFGQRPAIELTFTGINVTSYFQPGSIKVKNLTQGGDTVLYYPDTLLVLDYVGIDEQPGLSDGFRVMQNFPNPVADRTTIGMYIPESDNVSWSVTDVLGRRIITSERFLEKGYHSFLFTPAGEKIYLFTASWQGITRTLKILNAGKDSGKPCSIEYKGCGKNNSAPLKSSSDVQGFPFSPGDQLLCIGYADTLESAFLDSPETSQDYVFQFASNIPCPGLDSVYYEGQWYHTIQIFSQCWIRENMNAGIMIPSTQAQTNNDIIEKYCMGNDESYCNIVGGLYFWNEMMKYINVNEGQGICPEGFHIPGDLEWQILEGAADSEYEIGDPVWGINNWRGTDAGGNLKQTGTIYWVYPNTGATDAFGFTALPGGYFIQNAFWGIGYKAYFWSSHPIQKFYRNLDWNQAMIQRNAGGGETAGFSVRCIRN